jgi:tetratricopeptide (TPR) repeat protein
MTKDEAQELIDSTAADLDIANLLTQDYRQQLYLESEGHPYVIKILLGEVAKSGVARKPERIMAGEEQILDALFESTYNNTLSPAAQRIFLNLSNWRSVVPQLALEAVLLRDSEEGESERTPVGSAIEELYKSSFADIRESPEDGEPFVFVPLTASLFGQRALDVSSLKNTVQADLDLLHKFGATQQTDIQRGIKPKVENLFRNVESERGAFNKYLPVLEIVARRYPPAWRHMVFLYERSSTDDNLDKAKRAVEHYLQLPRQAEDEQGRMEAWKKLAELRRRTADFTGEVDALLGMCRLPGCPIEDISYSARRVLALLSQKAETYSLWSNEERRLLYGELADQMERRIRELYPNDFGYLGWLRFNRGEREKAEKFTKQGLSRNPDNEHLNNLAKKLFI